MSILHPHQKILIVGSGATTLVFAKVLILAKVLVLTAGAIGGLGITSSFVYGSLGLVTNAGSDQVISEGTLSLSQSPSKLTGAPRQDTILPVKPLTPGDTENRYIDLKNNGTLKGSEVVLSIIANPSNALTTDKEDGLQVSINQCSINWNFSGACFGTETKVLKEVSAVTLSEPVPLTLSSLKTGSVSHLKISDKLPADSDHSENGVVRKDSMEGLSTNIVWKFQEKS